ncbi:MAG: hypothetical protein H0T79_21825 [Deltaproteobacteria bacterium]|nr:hypothetical protein [Deltaproteobacteria bacterium]
MRSLAITLALVACGAPQTRRQDAPAVHGMALFGDARTFASHLPMFHAPHDYQVLLQVTLEPHITLAPGELYTIAPTPFELARVETPGYAMTVDVYRGHFERGGTRVAAATARIERVLRFTPLNAATTGATQPRFVLFGTAREAFLVHVITTRPDFDQIVRVTVPAGLDLTTPREVRITRSPTAELTVGETVEASVGDKSITLRVDAQLYLERDDLAM